MKIRFLFSLLFLYADSIHAQENLQEIEKILSADFQRITDARLGSDDYSYDSIGKYNTLFRTDLLKYLTQYPATLQYPFDSLRSIHMEIVTSEDRLFRIYSWNTWMGGTELDFENVMQYKSGDKVFIKANRYTIVKNDDGYIFNFTQLYSLQANHKTYYLGTYLGIFSSQDAGMGIKVFTIKNNRLNDSVKLFKTRSGMANEIYFTFVDNGERPLPFFQFDAKNKIIRFPVVLANEKVTKRLISYQFTGSYFEKIK